MDTNLLCVDGSTGRGSSGISLGCSFYAVDRLFCVYSCGLCSLRCVAQAIAVTIASFARQTRASERNDSQKSTGSLPSQGHYWGTGWFFTRVYYVANLVFRTTTMDERNVIKLNFWLHFLDFFVKLSLSCTQVVILNQVIKCVDKRLDRNFFSIPLYYNVQLNFLSTWYWYDIQYIFRKIM